MPITDPYSIPLRIRVVDSTSGPPKTCYCSRFIPISELLTESLEIQRPPTYKYNALKNINKSDTNKTKMMAAPVKLLDNVISDDELKTSRHLGNDINDVPREYENLILETDDEAAEAWAEESELDDPKNDDDTGTLPPVPEADHTLIELDNYHLNMGIGIDRGNAGNGREWR